jgi:hypothetical protein
MCKDFDVGQARVNPTMGGMFVYGQKAYLYFVTNDSMTSKIHIYNLQDISNHLVKSA